MMCCSQIWNIVAALASALFSGCLVLFSCRQTRIQKDNYKLSLFKERFRAISPSLSAYSYFEGGLDKFIRAFIFEDKESQIPERGYVLKRDLQDSKESFLAIFHEKEKDFSHFLEDYRTLLGKARVMCQNLPKKQSGSDLMDLHTFIIERPDSESISIEDLVKDFPAARGYINDFCEKQSEFVNRYCSFIYWLRDKVVI